MTRVLLTGASGFVGTHVASALLAAGFEVHAVGRRRPEHQAVRFLGVDLLDPASRQHAVERVGATHMLHLAWFADPGVYWRSPANLDWAVASLDLLRLFHMGGGQRAVLTGSCAEYEWGAARLHETRTDLRPATLYGVAKASCGQLAMAYARETGLSAAWARLFFLYGPGERRGRLVADAIATLRAGTEFATSPGVQRRDYMHVGDAAAALVQLLGAKAEGAVNVASGHAVPVRDILNGVAELLGARTQLRFGARALAAGEPDIIEAEVGRLGDEVGFQPHFDLYAGLADTVSAALR